MVDESSRKNQYPQSNLLPKISIKHPLTSIVFYKPILLNILRKKIEWKVGLVEESSIVL